MLPSSRRCCHPFPLTTSWIMSRSWVERLNKRHLRLSRLHLTRSLFITLSFPQWTSSDNSRNLLERYSDGSESPKIAFAMTSFFSSSSSPLFYLDELEVVSNFVEHRREHETHTSVRSVACSAPLAVGMLIPPQGHARRWHPFGSF